LRLLEFVVFAQLEFCLRYFYVYAVSVLN